MPSLRDEMFAVVRKIPSGTCMSYGMLGRSISSPVSGLIAGRWMAQCPVDAPWWRVIGADGMIKTFGRGPEVGVEQARMLQQEGFEVDGEKVTDAQSRFWDPVT